MKKLKTSHILKLTVGIVRGLLNPEAAPNSIYSGKELLYHLLSTCISPASISQVANSTPSPAEGTIRALYQEPSAKAPVT